MRVPDEIEGYVDVLGVGWIVVVFVIIVVVVFSALGGIEAAEGGVGELLFFWGEDEDVGHGIAGMGGCRHGPRPAAKDCEIEQVLSRAHLGMTATFKSSEVFTRLSRMMAPLPMTITFLGTSSGGGPSDSRNCSSLVADLQPDGSLWSAP